MENLTDSKWYQDVLKAGEAVVVARANLAAAEAEFHRLLQYSPRKSGTTSSESSRRNGGKQSTTSPQRSAAPTSDSVATRVKRVLAAGKKLGFAEILQGVLARGPATKFAVRSALSKAREKGLVKFEDGVYWMPTPEKKKPGATSE